MTLMGIVSSYRGLLVARFFLGIAEVNHDFISPRVSQTNVINRLDSFPVRRKHTAG